MVALYERAVGLYANLVNVNAYHQPGECVVHYVCGPLAFMLKLCFDSALCVQHILTDAAIHGHRLLPE